MAMFSESVSVGTRGDRTVIVSELARECVVIQGFTLDCYGGKGSMIFLTRAAALKVAELLGRWAAQPIQDVEPVNVGQQSGESPERYTTLPVFQDVEPVNVGQQSGESPERYTTLPVFLKL